MTRVRRHGAIVAADHRRTREHTLRPGRARSATSAGNKGASCGWPRFYDWPEIFYLTTGKMTRLGRRYDHSPLCLRTSIAGKGAAAHAGARREESIETNDKNERSELVRKRTIRQGEGESSFPT